jgi:hypothetical protein
MIDVDGVIAVCPGALEGANRQDVERLESVTEWLRRAGAGRVLDSRGIAESEISLRRPTRPHGWLTDALIECEQCHQVVKGTSPVQRHCPDCRRAIRRARSDTPSEGRDTSDSGASHGAISSARELSTLRHAETRLGRFPTRQPRDPARDGAPVPLVLLAEPTAEARLFVRHDEQVEAEPEGEVVGEQRYRNEEPRLAGHDEKRADVDRVADPPIWADGHDSPGRIPGGRRSPAHGEEDPEARKVESQAGATGWSPGSTEGPLGASAVRPECQRQA